MKWNKVKDSEINLFWKAENTNLYVSEVKLFTKNNRIWNLSIDFLGVQRIPTDQQHLFTYRVAECFVSPHDMVKKGLVKKAKRIIYNRISDPDLKQFYEFTCTKENFKFYINKYLQNRQDSKKINFGIPFDEQKTIELDYEYRSILNGKNELFGITSSQLREEIRNTIKLYNMDYNNADYYFYI